MTTRTIAETYASVKETYSNELKIQEKTNRGLARLNAKVEQLFYDLEINNLQSVNPEHLESSIRDLRLKLATLTARKVDFDSLKERVAEAMNFSTRDPIDETCFSTISDLDPKLAEKVTELFNEAQVFNKELIRNHTHLKELAGQNSRLMKHLNANIEKLNTHLENRGLCSWIAKKVCAWLDPQATVTVNTFTAPISNRQIEECELDNDYEEEAPVAIKKEQKAPAEVIDLTSDDDDDVPVVKQQTKVPKEVIDLTDDDEGETTPAVKQQTKAPTEVTDLTSDDDKKEATIATKQPKAASKNKKEQKAPVEEQPSTRALRSHSKKAAAPAATTPAPIAEKPKAASKNKKEKKAPVTTEEAPPRVLRSHSKKAAAPAATTPALEKTEETTKVSPAKKPKLNRELAGLGITQEDLLNVLQSTTTRSTRSGSKK